MVGLFAVAYLIGAIFTGHIAIEATSSERIFAGILSSVFLTVSLILANIGVK